MNESAFLTMFEAATELGFKPPFQERKSLRYLRAMERRLGVEILIKHGEARRTRYLVARTTLERYCPTMLDVRRRNEMLEMLREHVAKFDERIAELSERDTALARAIAEIARAIRLRVTV